jgi:hypothetical protein
MLSSPVQLRPSDFVFARVSLSLSRYLASFPENLKITLLISMMCDMNKDILEYIYFENDKTPFLLISMMCDKNKDEPSSTICATYWNLTKAHLGIGLFLVSFYPVHFPLIPCCLAPTCQAALPCHLLLHKAESWQAQ